MFRELADGTGVLLHLDSTAYHGVNQTGVMIWTLLEDGNTLTGITSELRSRFEGTPPTLAEDVAEYVEELLDRDLIVVEDEAAAPEE